MGTRCALGGPNPDCLLVHSSSIEAVLDTIANGREQMHVTFATLGILWLTVVLVYVNTLLGQYVFSMVLWPSEH